MWDIVHGNVNSVLHIYLSDFLVCLLDREKIHIPEAPAWGSRGQGALCMEKIRLWSQRVRGLPVGHSV